jgi:hypothetical protein
MKKMFLLYDTTLYGAFKAKSPAKIRPAPGDRKRSSIAETGFDFRVAMDPNQEVRFGGNKPDSPHVLFHEPTC